MTNREWQGHKGSEGNGQLYIGDTNLPMKVLDKQVLQGAICSLNKLTDISDKVMYRGRIAPKTRLLYNTLLNLTDNATTYFWYKCFLLIITTRNIKNQASRATHGLTGEKNTSVTPRLLHRYMYIQQHNSTYFHTNDNFISCRQDFYTFLLMTSLNNKNCAIWIVKYGLEYLDFFTTKIKQGIWNSSSIIQYFPIFCIILVPILNFEETRK